MRLSLLSALIFCAAMAYGRESDPAEIKQLAKTSPLSFIENKGQITDQYYQPRPDVDYKLRAGGVVMFVGDGQLHYQWYQADPMPDLAKYMDDPEGLDKAMENRNTRIYRMDVELLGANKKAKVTATEQQDYYEQY